MPKWDPPVLVKRKTAGPTDKSASPQVYGSKTWIYPHPLGSTQRCPTLHPTINTFHTLFCRQLCGSSDGSSKSSNSGSGSTSNCSLFVCSKEHSHKRQPHQHSPMAPGLCVVCLEFADCKRCECGGGWYCGRKCQHFDWQFSEDPHKVVCPIMVLREICIQYNVSNELRSKIQSFL